MALLEPILEQNPGFRGSADAKSSVAIFRCPEVMLTVPVDSSVRPVVKVGETFDLRTILAVSDQLTPFYILALSQKRTRLLECTRRFSKEVPFPAGFPTSLADAMQTKKPDHVLDNRSSGGPSTGSMKGVLFGTSSDREAKDEYLLHFLMQVDKAVNILLKGQEAPLVVVGVEQEIAMYQRVNSYWRLAEGGVHGAPDGLESGEMHARVLELLGRQPAGWVSEVLRDFDKKVGSGRASVQRHEIVAAAFQGRVSHLFLQDNAHYEGTYDPVRQEVTHNDDPEHPAADLLDAAARETLKHGGVARLLPAAAMPNGVPACALFRYAAESPNVA